MKNGEKKMGKKEMNNIHAGAEKRGGRGSGAPGSKCTFAAGSCCRRTRDCPTNANG